MINKFLEMLGVEMDEKFNIRYTENGLLSNCNPYHFEISDGNFYLFDCYGNPCNGYIGDIISGLYKIEKLPWKPKDGDAFYYIDSGGAIYRTKFSECYFPDLYHFKMGNCFKTREDAEAHKGEIMKQLKEIKKELNA